MRVVLEIVSGSRTGRKIPLLVQQSIQVGRTEWADWAIPEDGFMSGVHFAVDHNSHACRLRDLGSRAGTSLNGEKVMEAALSNGDRIVAGRTTFIVHIEQPGPTVAAHDSPSIRATDSQCMAETWSDGQSPLSSIDAPLPKSGEYVSSQQPVMPAPRPVPRNAPKPYRVGLDDKDPSVRREALFAAAWTRQPWLLEYCRGLCRRPSWDDWDALLLLAILCQPSDLDHILMIARTAEIGPRRFEALGAFGHPGVMRDLLQAIDCKDPHTTVAAGAAFCKITGADIDSEQRVSLPPEDGSEPDEFEQEFLDEATLPCPTLAQQHWNRVRDDFSKATRWCRGLDVSVAVSDDILNELDLESRWEVLIRENFEGTRRVRPIDIHKFPQIRKH